MLKKTLFTALTIFSLHPLLAEALVPDNEGRCRYFTIHQHTCSRESFIEQVAWYPIHAARRPSILRPRAGRFVKRF